MFAGDEKQNAETKLFRVLLFFSRVCGSLCQLIIVFFNLNLNIITVHS